MSETLLNFVNIHRTFSSEGIEFTALQNINLQIKKGEFIGLSGKSGSGKTTLLNLAGLIDPPTKGDIFFKNINTKSITDNELSLIRAQEIGYIFQTFNLLPLLSALENVEYPLMLLNLGEEERIERAQAALKKVGLENFTHHRPSQLSGGQRQRVAFARAIVKTPTLILADEPTGNLDSVTGDKIMNLIFSLNKKLGCTVILVTHDNDLAKQTDMRIRLKDGKIESIDEGKK